MSIGRSSRVSTITASSQAIVRAVIGLGKALNVPVIAEGVETEGERMFLKREGCARFRATSSAIPRPSRTTPR